MSSLMTIGVLRIRNDSGAPYAIDEMPDVTIADGAEIDMLDPLLASFYDNWEAANSAATRCAGASLYQSIQTNDITIVESTPPRRKTPFE